LNSKIEQDLKKYEYKKEFKEKRRKVFKDGLKKLMSDMIRLTVTDERDNVG
jgi:hypothetical protein